MITTLTSSDIKTYRGRSLDGQEIIGIELNPKITSFQADCIRAQIAMFIDEDLDLDIETPSRTSPA